MQKIELKVEGFITEIIGDITPAHDVSMKRAFCWADPLDLTSIFYFYSDSLCYTGVHKDVAEFLTKLGYEVTISKTKEFPKKFKNSKFLGKYRALQEEAVEALIAARYGFLEAPPSIGKTVIMAAITAKLGLPAIIVVEASEPFDQAVKAIEKFTNLTVGQIKTAKFTLGQVNVITRQTWLSAKKNKTKAILDAVKNAEVVLIDEAHNVQGSTYIDMLHSLDKAKYIIGVSGTAFTDNHKEAVLAAMLGKVEHRITLTEAIDNNLVVPISVICEDIPAMKGPRVRGSSRAGGALGGYQDIKNQYIYNNRERDNIIASIAHDAIAEDKSVAIVIDNIEHGKVLENLIKGSVLLTATMKDRGKLFEKFENKEIMCIISTLIDEATNIPTLDVVVLAAGGKNRKTLLQRSLRCGRTFEGTTKKGYTKKKRGYVFLPIDNCDFLKQHSASNLQAFKKYLREHPKNEIYVNNKKIKL